MADSIIIPSPSLNQIITTLYEYLCQCIHIDPINKGKIEYQRSEINQKIRDYFRKLRTMWWILLAIVAVAVSYLMLVWPYKYWVEKGVKQGSPIFPFGDSWRMYFQKQSFTEMVEYAYNMCPNTRYSGFYQLLFPTLVLKDPDLIKQITVKDFDHFVDHRGLIPEDCDPLWGKNLFSLTGQRWREMRNTLSPTFTSSKMKYMFSLMSQSGEQFVKHFLKKNEDVITVEMKDTFTRFTTDVIANTAFGIECDSLEERENEFYVMGKEATDFSGFWKHVKAFGFLLIPSLFKIFKVPLFSQRVSKFFTHLVKSNIESREKHGIVRPDMIHLLMEARKHGFKHEETQPIQDAGFATVEESEIGKNLKQTKREITDTDITSQALIFFFAGFDSVSSLMCFMSYELGVNQDVQEKLRQEVDETLEACNGTLTYEALLSMKYMDMVVSESLRKWPSAVAIDRICTKPYTIEPKLPEEKLVHVEKGVIVWASVYGLHRDAAHWPDPECFDPERFNEENKVKINPYTYLPFGSGPRNCIGSRFALLETKALFFHILASFEIIPVEKTQIPLRLSRKAYNMTAEGGFWFGLKKRVT